MKNYHKRPTFEINSTYNLSSCLLKIGNYKFRALVDTGAAVSLISKRMYYNLFLRPNLCKNDIFLFKQQMLQCNSLIAIGYVNISYKISGLTLDHKPKPDSRSRLAQEKQCSFIFDLNYSH